MPRQLLFLASFQHRVQIDASSLLRCLRCQSAHQMMMPTLKTWPGAHRARSQSVRAEHLAYFLRIVNRLSVRAEHQERARSSV